MAFLDTTPTSLIIERLSADRRSPLDPSSAYRIAVEKYGYVVDLLPEAGEESPADDDPHPR